MKGELIVNSVGRPPEKYADRIMADMIRQIARDRDKRWDNIHAILATMSDGNEKGQRRALNRLRVAGGKFFFLVDLIPGKRGKYTFHIVDLFGYDPYTDSVIEEDSIAFVQKPWLACTITKFTSKGRYQYDEKTMNLILFTHHAMSRLAQRCNAKTVDDLIVATRSMFDSFLVAWHESINVLNGYRLPFTLHDNSIAEAVLRDRDGCAMVTTILLPSE